jgi:hypothetical protein
MPAIMRAALASRMLTVLVSASFLGCGGSSDGGAATGGAAGGGAGKGGSSGGAGGSPTGGTSGSSGMGGGGTDGGSGPDGGASPQIATPDPARVKWCSDGTRMDCAKLQACFPGVLKINYGDLATCQTRAVLACAGQPAVPGSTVTPAMQAACLQARMNQSCEDYYNDVALPACSFKGSRAVGASCLSDEQCVTGNCDAVPGQLCGACTAYLAAGASCASGGTCGSGLFCLSDVCAALGKVGSTCGANQPCGYGLFCNAGSCAPQAVEGSTCDPAATDTVCSDAKDLVCDPAANKCVVSKYVATGQVCNQTTFCPGGHGCAVASATATMGTCTPLAQQGEMCSRNLPCVDPFSCLVTSANAISGTCGVRPVLSPDICN